MTTHFIRTALLATLLAPASLAHAQQGKPAASPDALFVVAGPAQGFHVLESVPLESIALVKNAAFYADAVTEFTQILGDGNRIERRYASSIARDSRGRTRREEEIALVGPLAAAGPTPKLVTIVDPDARVSYTLDENQRIAHRNGMAAAKLVELSKVLAAHNVKARAGGGPGAITTTPLGTIELSKVHAVRSGDADASTVVMESLGTKVVEGVKADGTRTTSTIPAGAIGNLMPIAVVTERWFSPELHMAVLITRRDPRSGETIYRLTNIVRAEPHDSLFSVPSDYAVRDGKLGSAFVKKLAPRR